MDFLDDTTDTPALDVLASDAALNGGVNTPPLIGSPASSPADSPFTGIGNWLGSIGTVARDLGTAVGTIRHDIAVAGPNYRAAERAAANPSPTSKLQQWWLYASGTDKAVILLGGLGVMFAAAQFFKGK